MPSPDVSVIIPTYNRKEYLQQAIASCFTGNEEIDVEVIVVDDGSQDGTRAYLQQLDDERVRPILQQHQGAQVARNRGLHEALGTFVKFLDDDDWLGHGALAEQFCVLSNKGGNICVGDLRILEGEKEWIFEQSLNEDLITSIFEGSLWTHTHVFLYRRSFVQGNHLWSTDIPFHQDTHFAISVASDLPTFVQVDDVVGTYRVHEGDRVSNRKSEIGLVERKKAKIEMITEGLDKIRDVQPHHTKAALSGIWREAHILAAYDLDAFRWAYQHVASIESSYTPERLSPYLRWFDKIVGPYSTEHVLYPFRRLKNTLSQS